MRSKCGELWKIDTERRTEGRRAGLCVLAAVGLIEKRFRSGPMQAR